MDFDVDDPPARSRRNKNRLILVAAFPYKGGLCSARSPLYDLSWAATERGVCGYRGPESLTYRNNGHFAPHSTNSPKAKTGGSLNLGEGICQSVSESRANTTSLSPMPKDQNIPSINNHPQILSPNNNLTASPLKRAHQEFTILLRTQLSVLRRTHISSLLLAAPTCSDKRGGRKKQER